MDSMRSTDACGYRAADGQTRDAAWSRRKPCRAVDVVPLRRSIHSLKLQTREGVDGRVSRPSPGMYRDYLHRLCPPVTDVVRWCQRRNTTTVLRTHVLRTMRLNHRSSVTSVWVSTNNETGQPVTAIRSASCWRSYLRDPRVFGNLRRCSVGSPSTPYLPQHWWRSQSGDTTIPDRSAVLTLAYLFSAGRLYWRMRYSNRVPFQLLFHFQVRDALFLSSVHFLVK